MRYARADGSKGSNKKVLEEATPWLEMKMQIINKKHEEKSNIPEVNSTSQGESNKLLGSVKKSKKRKFVEEPKDKDSKNIHQPEYNENAKKKKDGKPRDVEKINETPIVNSLKKKNKFKKKKEKKNNDGDGRKEKVLEKKKDFVVENGKRFKVFKDGVKKTWFDLPFEENEVMTRYKTMYVKRDMVKVLDDLKKSLEDEGVDPRKIANKLLTKERKAHNKLRVELLREQINLVQKETGQKPQKIKPNLTVKRKKDDKNKENENKIMPTPTITSETKEKPKKKKLKNASIESVAAVEELTEVELVHSGGETQLNLDIKEKNKTFKTKKSPKPEKKSRKLDKEKHKSETIHENDTSTSVNTIDDKRETNKSNPKIETKDKNKAIKIKNDKKQSDVIIENGRKFKVFKGGAKKPWIDLVFEETEEMTKYNTFFVKREAVNVLDILKVSLSKEGLDSEKIALKMKFEEKKAHNKLRKELLAVQLKFVKEEKQTQKIEREERSKTVIKSKLNYEENEMMAKFEDHWVLRNNLNHLHKIRDMKVTRIINAREDENQSEELTEEETLTLRRLMKKEKRRSQRMLDLELIAIKRQENNEDDYSGPKKKSKPAKYIPGAKYGEENDSRMVKFQGYWVKKEAGERLTKLTKNLENEGASQTEVFNAIKNERRHEERELKRENKLFCFNCRKSGHFLSECPNETAANVCFTCGSTEHMARDCSARKSGGPQFAHATCFVCGKTGHISRECPDNPRGLYPHGGCCNECGSVEHLRMNCPGIQVKNEGNQIRLDTINPQKGIESMDFGEAADDSKSRKNKRTVFD